MADATAVDHSSEASAFTARSFQETHEKAQLCVAAEEFEQAIAFLDQALALVSTATSSYALSLSLIPSEDLNVSPASQTATLLLERAECLLRMLDFDRALVDITKAKELDKDSASLARIHCEALFGLKQERQALKIWTAALLKSPLSSDLKLLKRKFPIAAVHVLHAVAMAKADAANRETVDKADGDTSLTVEQTRDEEIVVPEEVFEAPLAEKTQLPPEETGSTTPPPELEQVTDERLPDDADDQIASWLLRSDSNGTLSEPGTPMSCSASFEPAETNLSMLLSSSLPGSNLGASFEATDTSLSMLLSSPFVSVKGSECATSPSSTSSQLDASFVNMDLSSTQVLEGASTASNDSSLAIASIDQAIRAQPRTPDTLAKLYDHAVAAESSRSSTPEQKITAFLQYVAFTPLDDQWIPDALYSVSALYLESRKYTEAAQIRFLVEECELLHERLGVKPPLTASQESLKKREVEHAFTPPWLVLSFDQQRVCVQKGSLHCHLCSLETPLPLVQYIDHRVKLCPGRKATA